MPRGRPKRLKLEERIALARRYHAGETPKVLAEAYGVSRRHVTRIAKEEKGEGQEVRDPSVAVSFRTAQSDLSAFDAEWRGLGFATRSQALQAMVRARCGVLSLMQGDILAFSETVQRAQGLSDSARVLAKAVKCGKLQLAMADRQLLSALLDLAQGTHRDLASLKAAAHRRRGDGWSPTEVVPNTPSLEGVTEPSDLEQPDSSLPPDNSETRKSIPSIDLQTWSAGDV